MRQLTMNRDIESLGSCEFDLIIVGGGIFGACAAWDAALRGWSVALIEQSDFGSGASANSFKMVHGGIRYLQHADLVRLRESSFERSAFLRVAPHLVQPLPIAIPTYGHGRKGRAFLGAGMTVYDALTFDRNRGIGDPNRRIPRSRFMDRNEVLSLYPGLPSHGLTGAAVFYDGQMYNPPRLVLAFVQSAADAGAVVANYVEAIELIKRNNRIDGVVARDRIGGGEIEIRGRVTLNAAGPWAEALLRRCSTQATIETGTYSRDACFIVPRRFDHPYALAVSGQTSDPDAVLSREARHLFAVPWRNHTLIGVWHVVEEAGPDAVVVTEQEIEEFIDEFNWAYPALNLKIEEVSRWNAGLVPFGENRPGQENLSYGKRSRLIDHATVSGIDGLVTLIGIRFTMGRGDAAKAIDLISKKLNLQGPPPPTHKVPIWGGDIDIFDQKVLEIADAAPFGLKPDEVKALLHNYGSQFSAVFEIAEHDPQLSEGLRGTGILKAEVTNAVRTEMAITLGDIVFRRTDLATGRNPGLPALRECARIAAMEIGWDEAKQDEEIGDVLRQFPSWN